MTERVYQLVRVLGAADGMGRLAIPLRAYTSQADATQAKKQVDEAMMLSMRAHIYQPNGAGQGQDMGRLVDFLRELGITGFHHAVGPVDVQGLIQTPEPIIVVP